MTHYLARAKDIKYMGPYETEREAWAAVMGHDGLPAEGALVWPVTEDDEFPLPIQQRDQHA